MAPQEVAGVEGRLLELMGPSEQTMLVALVPHEGFRWFFKMVGPSSLIEQQKPAFDRFLRSVRFDGTAGD